MRKGQVMILTTLTLGGTLLGATAIAGLLMAYQIRQAADFKNSAQAVFAADTGVEWGLYQFFKPTSLHPAPSFSGVYDAEYAVSCFTPLGVFIACDDPEMRIVRALGTNGNVNRALEYEFE